MKPIALPARPSALARRRTPTLAALSAALLAACAATPPAPPATPPLDERLRQAEIARAQGSPAQARQLWQQAAREHPASKQPWLSLADDHLRAGEHGSAIAAAQEAAQRDPQDRGAQGILALGGLRIATAALSGLREQPDALSADTRGELVSLARLLREALGETPTPAASPAAAAPPRTRPRPARTAPAAAPPPATTPAAPRAAGLPAATTVPGAPATPAAARPPVNSAVPAPNPFDRLR